MTRTKRYLSTLLKKCLSILNNYSISINILRIKSNSLEVPFIFEEPLKPDNRIEPGNKKHTIKREKNENTST